MLEPSIANAAMVQEYSPSEKPEGGGAGFVEAGGEEVNLHEML